MNKQQTKQAENQAENRQVKRDDNVQLQATERAVEIVRVLQDAGVESDYRTIIAHTIVAVQGAVVSGMDFTLLLEFMLHNYNVSSREYQEAQERKAQEQIVAAILSRFDPEVKN